MKREESVEKENRG